MKLLQLILILLFLANNGFSQTAKPLLLDDNTYVTINEMRVKGNSKTRDQVIFGESRIRVGDSISIKQLNVELQESRRNLLNIRLFTEVDIAIEKWTNDNKINLLFEVQERWYIYPIPSVDLTGITISEWRNDHDYSFDRLTYGLSVYNRNLTRNADILQAGWKGGFQKQIAANYTLTGIGKRRNWGLGFGFNNYKNKGVVVGAEENNYVSPLFDETVIEGKSASFVISRRKEINRRHSLGLVYNNLEVADTVISLNPNFFANQETIQHFGTLLYTFNLEKRDLVEYPTRGYNVGGNMGYDGVFSEDQLSTFSIGGIFNTYHEFKPKQYLSGSISGRYLVDDNIPFYNLTRKVLRSRDRPRGFSGERIFPKSYITFKSEYRYDLVERQFDDIPILPSRFEPVPWRILPKAFFDLTATISDQLVEENPLNDDILYSFGVGVDIVTIYNTPVIIEISRNSVNEISFGFGLGKTF